MTFDAGKGAFSTDFYPASSIKVLAAVRALELAYASGSTGEATVDEAYSLAEYYDPPSVTPRTRTTTASCASPAWNG